MSGSSGVPLVFFHFQEVATRSVQRRRGNSGLKAWISLLWALALLGLLLLPSDYRAGAEIAHGHSLVQLWVDATDGTVDHAHDHHLVPDPASPLTTSWLDPLVGDPGTAGSSRPVDEAPDAAKQHDSAPTASGIQLLLTTGIVLLAVGWRLEPAAGSDRLVTGLSPRVVVPPPRWTPHPA
ncbi:MAG: hypothetical protein KY456_11535 [Chloroflexi bacterium]|nr:hypothetical protein [Chloroflexota bacterium]